jgi:hypothetical protein
VRGVAEACELFRVGSYCHVKTMFNGGNGNPAH